MDRKSWERRNFVFAFSETNREVESQRLELHHAKQWADHAQRENSGLFAELAQSAKKITQNIVKN